MTLTEAAHWTKRLIWFVLAGFILFIILVMVILNRTRPQHLPQYMFPDFACTATKEEFLEHRLSIDSINYTLESSADAFTLETQTGRIAQLPSVINVYRYDNPGQYLTVQKDAESLAEALNFQPERMQRVGTTTYRWADDYGRTLTVQARNFVFDLKVDFSRTSARPPSGDLPTEEEAKTTARDFLSSQNLLTRDYLRNNPETIDITIEANGTLREGKYKQETDLIRVDFFREASMMTIPSNVVNAEEIRNMLERQGHRSTTEDITTPEGRITLFKFNTPIVTNNDYHSNISVYVGGRSSDLRGRNIARIYGIEYKNWILEPEYCGTYQLLDPAQVLTYVQNEQASLMYLNEKDGDNVLQDGTKNVRNFTVKDINIVYYDAPHEQEFLQPVYAITGEATFTTGTTGSFVFYYPAIDYNFVQDRQVQVQQE